MKQSQRLSLLAVLLVIVGIGLCFMSVFLGDTTNELTFTPLSDQELAACPTSEPLALRDVPAQKPIALSKATYRPAVSDDYFDEVLFIGDSLTNGLELFGTLKNASYFCATSATVAGTLADPNLDRQLSARPYRAVYVMLGINEMGTHPTVYADRVAQLIARISTHQPDARICLQTVLPVVPELTWSDSVFSVANIQAANAALRQLADNKRVTIIDTYYAFADSTGRMPDGLTRDGVHLHQQYYAVWCDYLRTHIT